MPSDTIMRATATGRWLTAADAPAGSIRAVVSAYGVKYRIGWALWHTIEMGAFAASIAAQDAIPLFWMHSWDWTEQTPVGDAQAEESTEENGLVVDGGLYVAEDPAVARLHRAAVAGAIREWSIGYRVIAERLDPDDDMHMFVTEAELLESSLVLRGANPETRTLEVASAQRTCIRIGDIEIESNDPEVIASFLGNAVEDTESEAAARDLASLPWSALRRLRELHGDALAGTPAD